MQNINISKSDFFTLSNKNILITDIEKVILSNSVIVDYYSYNTITKDFDLPFKLSLYVEYKDKDVQTLDFSKGFIAVTLSKYFVDLNKKPNKKDKIKLNDEFYFVGNISYSNTLVNLPLIDDSILTIFDIVKINEVSRKSL